MTPETPMPKKVKNEKHYEVSHTPRECSHPGCHRFISHFAYQPDDWDGRVWCVDHQHEARASNRRRYR